MMYQKYNFFCSFCINNAMSHAFTSVVEALFVQITALTSINNHDVCKELIQGSSE